MRYILILLFAAEAVMSYIFMYKSGTLKQKMLTSSVFLLTGIYIFVSVKMWNSAFACLLLAGLFFSFIGDWVLRFKVFGIPGLPGIVFFALAHIAYTGAYFTRVPPSATTLILLIPWALMLTGEIILAKKMKIKLGSAAPAVAVYAAIINVMVISGVRAGVLCADLSSPLSIIKSAVLIAGVIMFIISDAGVCLMMFDGREIFSIGKKTYRLNSYNIVTYFGGQMLIAASMLI